jgi:hypothetical protein
MTPYPRAFNLVVNFAEHVLFVLFYEQQTPVFVLHPIWPNTSSSSCCFSSTNSSKLFAPYFLFDMTFRTSSIIHVACPQSHALVGRDCWGLRSNVWSSPAMSSALVGRDHWGSQIGSPAMSVPSWRDRHSACCQIIKQKSSSPAMSNALVARPPFGLLSK